MEIKNRKAYFDYYVEREIECGIVLSGTEIKSIRKGNCNIKDCYGIIKNHEKFSFQYVCAKVRRNLRRVISAN